MSARFSARMFVYGTLLQGEHNHHWLAGAALLGVCRAPACYTLLDLGSYPAAAPGGRTAIAGEVYALDKNLLTRLDRLEHYPQAYGRRLIPTPYGPAWMYYYRRPYRGAAVIPGGDWRQSPHSAAGKFVRGFIAVGRYSP